MKLKNEESKKTTSKQFLAKYEEVKVELLKGFHQNTSETKHILLVVFQDKHRHRVFSAIICKLF